MMSSSKGFKRTQNHNAASQAHLSSQLPHQVLAQANSKNLASKNLGYGSNQGL